MDSADGPVVAHLRSATDDDALAIEEVRWAGWKAAYRGIIPDTYLDQDAPEDEAPRNRLLSRASESPVELVAVDDEGRVVGWTVASPAGDDDVDPTTVAEIDACYVHPDHWRSGVGRQLLQAALHALAERGYEEVIAWVSHDNTQTRAFYASFGFRPDGRQAVLDYGAPVLLDRQRRTGPNAGRRAPL